MLGAKDRAHAAQGDDAVHAVASADDLADIASGLALGLDVTGKGPGRRSRPPISTVTAPESNGPPRARRSPARIGALGSFFSVNCWRAGRSRMRACSPRSVTARAPLADLERSFRRQNSRIRRALARRDRREEAEARLEAWSAHGPSPTAARRGRRGSCARGAARGPRGCRPGGRGREEARGRLGRESWGLPHQFWDRRSERWLGHGEDLVAQREAEQGVADLGGAEGGQIGAPGRACRGGRIASVRAGIRAVEDRRPARLQRVVGEADLALRPRRRERRRGWTRSRPGWWPGSRGPRP